MSLLCQHPREEVKLVRSAWRAFPHLLINPSSPPTTSPRLLPAASALKGGENSALHQENIRQHHKEEYSLRLYRPEEAENNYVCKMVHCIIIIICNAMKHLNPLKVLTSSNIKMLLVHHQAPSQKYTSNTLIWFAAMFLLNIQDCEWSLASENILCRCKIELSVWLFSSSKHGPDRPQKRRQKPTTGAAVLVLVLSSSSFPVLEIYNRHYRCYYVKSVNITKW